MFFVSVCTPVCVSVCVCVFLFCQRLDALPGATFDMLVSDSVPLLQCLITLSPWRKQKLYSLSILSIHRPFFLWGVLIRRLSVHHNALMNLQRCFVSCPPAPSIRDVMGASHCTYMVFLKFFQHITAEFLFCCRCKESPILSICDCLISIAMIWYNTIESVTFAIFYLRFPQLCLRYNRQFEIAISARRGKNPLLGSHPVNAKISSWAVAHSTYAILSCLCGVLRSTKIGKDDKDHMMVSDWCMCIHIRFLHSAGKKLNTSSVEKNALRESNHIDQILIDKYQEILWIYFGTWPCQQFQSSTTLNIINNHILGW